jgi:hypothetical protein
MRAFLSEFIEKAMNLFGGKQKKQFTDQGSKSFGSEDRETNYLDFGISEWKIRK